MLGRPFLQHPLNSSAGHTSRAEGEVLLNGLGVMVHGMMERLEGFGVMSYCLV
jgi:hypothetical protein